MTHVLPSNRPVAGRAVRARRLCCVPSFHTTGARQPCLRVDLAYTAELPVDSCPQPVDAYPQVWFTQFNHASAPRSTGVWSRPSWEGGNVIAHDGRQRRARRPVGCLTPGVRTALRTAPGTSSQCSVLTRLGRGASTAQPAASGTETLRQAALPPRARSTREQPGWATSDDAAPAAQKERARARARRRAPAAR